MAHVSHRNALLINGEIAAVIAAMRSNLKWAAGGRYLDEEIEDPLIEALKGLRRTVFSWQDWQQVEPLDYLTPFLQVIKSPETSGPITGIALTSVHKFLTENIIADSTIGVSEAIRTVCDSVTQCKFEATYPASDECVLSKILDVLVACVDSPLGKMLTNDNVINVFQACYRIGHYQTEKGRDTSELLTQASRRSLTNLVRTIFSRLESVPGSAGSGYSTIFSHTTARLQVSPLGQTPVGGTTPTAAATANGGPATQPFTTTQQLQQSGFAEGPDAGALVAPAAAGVTAAVPSPFVADSDAAAEGTGIPDSNTQNSKGATEQQQGGEEQSADNEQPEAPSSPRIQEIVSLLPTLATHPPESIDGTEQEAGYGSEAIREVLYFVISLVQATPTNKDRDLSAHGLELMCVALQAGGPAIEHHEHLLALIQEDLIKAMFAAATNISTLPCLAGICQVALALYVQLGQHLLLQLEAVLGLLLLPIAEGRGGVSLEQQQVALEGILDFCSQPGFIRDVYINMDCRIERSNLFESICGLLSKAAFPVNGPLRAVHLLSLDGIVSILASLSDSCNGGRGGAEEDQLSDPAQFIDIWTALTEGRTPPLLDVVGLKEGGPADLARVEKYLKGRLTAAAEHFNRDSKKGFQYLQAMKLLPQTLDASAVGRFLRACPGLAKIGIGEILGERDAFYEGVRDGFINTFNFAGLDFDLSLRLFMDSFRPPGEGQKIDRIMQSFGRRYYEQQPGSGIKSSDAAYVLAFSVIMLNTDLHNTQNKKKMSLEDFARINRSTNEGEPMPKELLEQIYKAISSDELKISTECSPEELPRQSVFWLQMARDAQRPRGKMLMGAETNAPLERDMFGLIWGPTLAAVSVILDNTSDPGVVRRAMQGLLAAAQLAATHQVDDVVDQIVVGLSKYTAALNPSNPRGGALAYGESAKAQAAVETIFAIANRYGDWLRAGWRTVLDCVVRLHKVGLLPAEVLASGDSEDPEQSKQRMPRPSSTKAKGSSGSLFSRAINSLISIEGSDPAATEQAQARDQQLMEAAMESAAACRVEEIIGDSKFLTAEALVELVKATMWAGGNVVAAVSTGEQTDTAELCLELLVTLVLRNRDRVMLIWPLVHEYIAACTSAENVEESNALVERAVMGLLRVAHRLLPYKEESADELLTSLRLIIGLGDSVAWALAEPIATELLALLKNSAPYVRSESDWRTVCAVIRLTAVRPEAAPVAFEALSVVCRDPRVVSGTSYMPLFETCMQLIDKYKQANADVAVRFLDLSEALFSWLVDQGAKLSTTSNADATPKDGSGGPSHQLTYATLLDLWLTTLGALAKGLCRDTCRPLRDTSLAVLHRAVTSSSVLNLPSEVWVQTTGELLVTLVGDLAKAAATKSKAYPGLDKSVRLAANMLTKALLQYVAAMQTDKDFYTLWQAALQSLQDCMAVRHEAVVESVPENVKNMLLVLASTGILTPEWKDAQGRSLWDLTWSKAGGISSGLNPQMLDAAGVGSPPKKGPAPIALAIPVAPVASVAVAAGGVEAAAAPGAPSIISTPAAMETSTATTNSQGGSTGADGAAPGAVAATEVAKESQQQPEQQGKAVGEGDAEGYSEEEQADQAASTCKQS